MTNIQAADLFLVQLQVYPASQESLLQPVDLPGYQSDWNTLLTRTQPNFQLCPGRLLIVIAQAHPKILTRY